MHMFSSCETLVSQTRSILPCNVFTAGSVAYVSSTERPGNALICGCRSLRLCDSSATRNSDAHQLFETRTDAENRLVIIKRVYQEGL